MLTYYGIFKEKKLKETEHDYYRDIAKNQFLVKNSNGNFEYENKSFKFMLKNREAKLSAYENLRKF